MRVNQSPHLGALDFSLPTSFGGSVSFNNPQSMLTASTANSSASSSSVWSSIGSAISSAFQPGGLVTNITGAYLDYRGSRDLQKINADRIKQGLPPINDPMPGTGVVGSGGGVIEPATPQASGGLPAWAPTAAILGVGALALVMLARPR